MLELGGQAVVKKDRAYFQIQEFFIFQPFAAVLSLLTPVERYEAEFMESECM